MSTATAHRPLVVRPATLDDADVVARIHVAAYESTYRGLIPDAEIDVRTIGLRRRVWRERLSRERPREFVLVAELDGLIRAFVSGRPAHEDEIGEVNPAVGCWENMYSDPGIVGDARGFGVALAMHRAVEATFHADGYREIVAFVVEGNTRAERFFELLGWRRDGGRREVKQEVQHRLRRTIDCGGDA